MLLNRLTEKLIVTALLLFMQGCGFQLKGELSSGSMALPVALQGTPEVQPLQYRLERVLRANGAQVIGQADDTAKLQIFLNQQQLARRVTARDSTGRASEYLLRLTATLEYRWLEEIPTTKSFSVERIYSYRNDQLLATHRQERQYLAEMQDQLAQQMTDYFSRVVQGSSTSEDSYAN